MNRIRKLRIQRNMTQLEVGQALGVGNTAVSMYECGHRKLDDENIRNLCKIFECSADYLLGITDYPNPYTEEDARLLTAYHKGNKRDRKFLDDKLAKYMPEENE